MAHLPHLFYEVPYQNKKLYKCFYLRDQAWDRNIQKRILLHLQMTKHENKFATVSFIS